MADTDNKLGKLYNALSSDPNYKVGDSASFVAKFSDPEKLGKLYDALSQDEKYQIKTEKSEWVGQFADLKKKDFPEPSASPSPAGTLHSATRSVNTEPALEVPVGQVPPPTPQAQAGSQIEKGVLTPEQTETTGEPNYFTKLAQGSAKAFNQGVGRMAKLLDHTQTLVESIISQPITDPKVKAIAEDRPAITRPFKAVSDAIDWANKNAADVPDDFVGNVAKGVAGIVPEIAVAHLMPSVAVEGWLTKYGIQGVDKFAMMLGGKGVLEGSMNAQGQGPVAQLTEPIIEGAKGVATGLAYAGIGKVAGEIAGSLTNKIYGKVAKEGLIGGKSVQLMAETPAQAMKRSVTQGTTSVLSNALLFGGYTGLEEAVRNIEQYGLEEGVKKIDWGTVAESAGVGLALGGKDLLGMWGKGVMAFAATPKDQINKVAQSKQSPEEMKAMSDKALEDLNKNIGKVKQTEPIDQFKLNEDIFAAQKRLNLPSSPEVLISDATMEILGRLQKGESVETPLIEQASSELYRIRKGLEGVSKSETRRFTTDQIFQKTNALGSIIETLENAKQAQLESGSFIDAQNKHVVSAVVNDNLATLKGFTEEVIKDPAKVKQAVAESSLPDAAKQDLNDKIDQVAHDNDPVTIATKPITDKIDELNTELQTVQEGLDHPAVKQIKTAEIQKEVSELNTKLADKLKSRKTEPEPVEELPPPPPNLVNDGAGNLTEITPKSVTPEEVMPVADVNDVPSQPTQPKPDQGAVKAGEGISLRGVKYSDIVVGDKYLDDILNENKLNNSEKEQVREVFSRGVDYFKFDKDGQESFQLKFANPEDITEIADIITGVSAAKESDFSYYNQKNYDNVKDAVSYILDNPRDYSPNVVNAVKEISQRLENPSSSMNRLYAIDVTKELGINDATITPKSDGSSSELSTPTPKSVTPEEVMPGAEVNDVPQQPTQVKPDQGEVKPKSPDISGMKKTEQLEFVDNYEFNDIIIPDNIESENYWPEKLVEKAFNDLGIKPTKNTAQTGTVYYGIETKDGENLKIRVSNHSKGTGGRYAERKTDADIVYDENTTPEDILDQLRDQLPDGEIVRNNIEPTLTNTKQEGKGEDKGETAVVIPSPEVKTDIQTAVDEVSQIPDPNVKGKTKWGDLEGEEGMVVYSAKDKPIEGARDTGKSIKDLEAELKEANYALSKDFTSANSFGVSQAKKALEGQIEYNRQEALESAGYLEYDNGTKDNRNGIYVITDKGKAFVDAVDARLETRRGVAEGTDLFPEMANIPEFKAKVDKIKSTQPISDETIKRITDSDPKELGQSATNIERKAASTKEADLVEAVKSADELTGGNKSNVSVGLEEQIEIPQSEHAKWTPEVLNVKKERAKELQGKLFKKDGKPVAKQNPVLMDEYQKLRREGEEYNAYKSKVYENEKIAKRNENRKELESQGLKEGDDVSVIGYSVPVKGKLRIDRDGGFVVNDGGHVTRVYDLNTVTKTSEQANVISKLNRRDIKTTDGMMDGVKLDEVKAALGNNTELFDKVKAQAKTTRFVKPDGTIAGEIQVVDWNTLNGILGGKTTPKPTLSPKVETTTGKPFTESKDLNAIYKAVKEKYGDAKGAKIYDAATRLVNPNQNEIVEVRSNGVIVKEGDKFIMKPFTNTDFNSKKWELGKGIDVTEQFAKTETTPTNTEFKGGKDKESYSNQNNIEAWRVENPGVPLDKSTATYEGDRWLIFKDNNTGETYYHNNSNGWSYNSKLERMGKGELDKILKDAEQNTFREKQKQIKADRYKLPLIDHIKSDAKLDEVYDRINKETDKNEIKKVIDLYEKPDFDIRKNVGYQDGLKELWSKWRELDKAEFESQSPSASSKLITKLNSLKTTNKPLNRTEGATFMPEWNDFIDTLIDIVNNNAEFIDKAGKAIEDFKAGKYYRSLTGTDKDKLDEQIKAVRDDLGIVEQPVVNETKIREPKLPTKESTMEGSGDDKPKAIKDRLMGSENITAKQKKGIEKDGLTYQEQTHEEAREMSKEIIEAVGIEDAVTMAEAGKFGGAVNSLVFAESLDRIDASIEKAPKGAEQTKLSNQWAKIAIQYDLAARESGRFISAVQDYYKKSPTGMVAKENILRGENFKKWSKNKDKSFREAFDEIIATEEGKAAMKDKFGEFQKEERKVVREERRQKIIDIFDSAKITKSGQSLYKIADKNSFVSAEMINDGIEAIKKAVLAGESVANAIETGIKTVTTKLGKEWDSDKFKKDWEAKLGDIDKTDRKVPAEEQKLLTRIKGLEKAIETYETKSRTGDFKIKDKKTETDAEVKRLIEQRDDARKSYQKLRETSQEWIDRKNKQWLNRLSDRLKGMNEKQKAEVVNRVAKQIIDKGGLDYQEFKDIIAETVGMGKLTPEAEAKIRELAKIVNGVEDAKQAALKNETPQTLKAYKQAQADAEIAGRELSTMLSSRADPASTFWSIMTLNTLGPVTLGMNVAYNLSFMPISFAKSGLLTAADYTLWGGSKALNKVTGGGVPVYTPTHNVFRSQGQYFNKMWQGVVTSTRQARTGARTMDYFSDKQFVSHIRPWRAMKDLWAWKKGDLILTQSEVIDKVMQALPNMGMNAEIVARGLNMGDMPFRFAIEGGEANVLARSEFGLKNKFDIDMFTEFPKEQAYKLYKKKGLSDEGAMEKAEYIQQRIIEKGAKGVMQNENYMNDFFQMVQRGVPEKSTDTEGQRAWKMVLNNFAKAAVKLNSPFIKIPANVAWNVFGLINPVISGGQSAIYAIASATAKVKGDNVKARKYADVSADMVAHMITGMALTAVVGSLLPTGIITPSDEDEKKRGADGQQLYGKRRSLNWGAMKRMTRGETTEYQDGDMLIDLQYFGVLGNLINIKAGVMETQQKAKNNEEDMGKLDVMAETMTQSLTELAANGVLSGHAGMMRAINQGGGYADAWGMNMVNLAENAVQPAGFAQISKSELGYKADIKADDFLKEIHENNKVRSMLYRGAFGDPKAKVTMWGDTARMDNSLKGVLYNMLRVSEYDDNKFGVILFKDFVKTGNDKFFPPSVSNTIEVDGRSKKLSPAEYRDLQTFIGQERKELVTPYVYDMAREVYMKNPQTGEYEVGKQRYSEKSEEAKLRSLAKVYSKGYEHGMYLFKQKYPQYQSKTKSK